MALNSAQKDVISGIKNLFSNQAKASETARVFLKQLVLEGLIDKQGLPLVTQEELTEISAFDNLSPEHLSVAAIFMTGVLTAAAQPLPGTELTSTDIMLKFAGAGALRG